MFIRFGALSQLLSFNRPLNLGFSSSNFWVDLGRNLPVEGKTIVCYISIYIQIVLEVL